MNPRRTKRSIIRTKHAFGSIRLLPFVVALGAALIWVSPHRPVYAGIADVDLDGTTWQFDGLTSKVKARASGIGRVRSTGSGSLELRFLSGGLWAADIDGSTLATGTYTRKGSRLTLALDESGAVTLATWFAIQVELAAAAEGVPLTLSLSISRSKALVFLKTRRGTMQAKLKAKIKLTGFASRTGFPDAPGNISGKLKGLSTAVPLGE